VKLAEWKEIEDEFKDALILGNGASSAVHSAFQYSSLWEDAIESELITDELLSLAKELKTGENIELLLRQLWTAEAVDNQFNIDESKIEKAYSDLRNALIETVRKIHCSHADSIAELSQATAFLKNFKTIFSLNYDLLVYWAIMASNDAQSAHRFKDCFNEGYFDEEWERFRNPIGQQEKCSLVFFPHGALQFVQRNSGIDRKLDSTHSFVDLLEHVLDLWERTSVLPLFVTEGDSSKKMRSIQRSSYLSTIYYEALPTSGPTLVIYGWSMNEDVDNHLLKQISKGRYTKVAVSVYVPTTPDIDEFVAATNLKLRRVGIRDTTYFNANSEGCWTHPLTQQAVAVE